MTTPPEPTLQSHHGRKRWTSRWVGPDGRQHAMRFGDAGTVSRKRAMIAYADWLPTWRQGNKVALENGGRYTVGQLCADERERARKRYTRNGKLTTSFLNIDLALRDLEDVYGDRAADAVGAPEIAALRDEVFVFRWKDGERVLDADGKPVRQSVRTVNYRLWCVQQAFQEARGRGKVSAVTMADVQAVKAIGQHDGIAQPAKDIRPVDDAIVEATLRCCSSKLADMVRVQRLAGMRPTEACTMRPCDIDRPKAKPGEAEVWFYSPVEHKTKYAGKARLIAIPPAAVAILRPYLNDRAATALIFTPAEHLASVPAKNPERQRKLRTAGESWSQTSYRRAIAWACKRAGVAKWNPNQLRHRWATEVRRVLGLEAVREGLSHASEKTSEIYAELSRERLTDLARKMDAETASAPSPKRAKR